LYTNTAWKVCQNLQSLLVLQNLKNKPDKFWSNQDIIFYYRAELTKTGSKSFINNFDR